MAYDAALRQRGSLMFGSTTQQCSVKAEPRTTRGGQPRIWPWLLGFCDGADAENGAPPGTTADRRTGRLHHCPARSGPRGAGPHDLEPPRRDAGHGSSAARLRSRAPAGGQYRAEALRLGGMAAGEARPKTRRSWRKLHIAVDADTGQIAAAALTTSDVDECLAGRTFARSGGWPGRLVHCRRYLRSGRRLWRGHRA